LQYNIDPSTCGLTSPVIARSNYVRTLSCHVTGGKPRNTTHGRS